MLIEKPVFLKIFLLIFFITLLSCKKDDESVVADDDPFLIDFSGEIQLAKTYGGSNEDDATSIIKTPDGGFAIAGFTLSNDGDIIDKTTTDADFWVFKLNADGSLLWSKTYGGSGDDRATKIINTQDGGFAVTGFTRSNDGDVSNNNGFYDYWLIKLDASGNLLWEKAYGFAGNDQGQSVIQTSDGGYFLTGFLDFDGRASQGTAVKSQGRHGVGEFWGIKTDASGAVEWTQYYGGTSNDRSYDVVQTDDGGFLMIGNTESDDFDITNSKGSYDFWAVRVTSAGDLIWAKNYGGSGIEIAYSITKSQDGNYFLIGDARSNDQDVTNNKGNADAWLIKINDNGDLLWQKTYGGSEFDTGRSVKQFSDSKIVIFGSSRSEDQDVSANYGQSDYWLIITDAEGGIIFEKNYGGSNLEFGNDSVITLDNTVVVVGSSQSSDFDVLENKGSKDALILFLN
jgi:hypothetical protein